MQIRGFQGTSLLDFPGRVAALVFTGGCNLRCPFCHNPGLVLDPEQYPLFPQDDLFLELEKRAGFIDGLVVSGGEPTLGHDLPAFLRRVKSMGLAVKLDTNGLHPAILEPLLTEGLVDYLAIDLKTSPKRYTELGADAEGATALTRSCRLAIDQAPAYEFRTTCVPGLVNAEDISAMGEVVQGGKLWVLQQYVVRDEMLGADAPRQSYPAEVYATFSALAQPYVVQVNGRGWR